MNIRKCLLIVVVVLSATATRAEEGMWLPLLLEKLNEKQMKSMGMKISAKDIYDINKGSLKDAIVSFGGFCTGELISSKGLVLTNHHCGFDAVQNHSTLDHNYIRDGFWAKTNGEELTNPGLFVTFIIRIEDVTKQVLAGAAPEMNESDRQSLVDRNSAQLLSTLKKESYQSALIKPFFDGNQYFAFITETYNDVRLVGAPPAAIGNFGKDTDNWMWPRHTGDFSIFRIYAGKDNKPAAYSPDNIPYAPRRSFSISMDGVAENDFTMVFGFPGKTTEYLHSDAIEQIVTVNDPAKIAIRTKALMVLDSFMRNDEKIKIQYAAKYAGISNAWKKWQGEILGINRTGAVEKRKNYERLFQSRVDASPQWKTKYGHLLADISEAYAAFKPLGLARDYYLEINSKLEILNIAAQLNGLMRAYQQGGEKAYNEQLVKVRQKLDDFYNEYSPAVDERMVSVLMKTYIADQEAAYISPLLKSWPGTPEKILFSESLLSNHDQVYKKILDAAPKQAVDLILADKAVQLYLDMLNTYNTAIAAKLNPLQSKINQLQRTYMQAQLDLMKEKKFYPDANSTLRLTYGNVKGFQARDAIKYDYYSYMDGLMEKYKPGDYEFDVPQKLRELYQAKDFGEYGKNGKMPVCFLASNHTTGGNSGSPALDAYGNLVGLNFDRAWEGTMSDISYDPSICRNIMVDIRYVLFIIDKFAGAGHLVKEMKLVHPKRK